jgi:hypothetical protein
LIDEDEDDFDSEERGRTCVMLMIPIQAEKIGRESTKFKPSQGHEITN